MCLLPSRINDRTSCIVLSTAGLMVMAALTAAGCANQKAAGSDPDEMSVEEHRQAADKEREKAEKHREQYDPNAARDPAADDPNQEPGELGGFYSTSVYNPTQEHLDEAEEHERHAKQHARAAQTLVKFEEKHCAKFPEKVRKQCPLMGQVAGVEEVEGGAKLDIADSVNLDAITDHMRCHFAFGRTQNQKGMESCPLYLEGLSFEKLDEDHAVIIRTDDEARVEAVRERSRAHLN